MAKEKTDKDPSNDKEIDTITQRLQDIESNLKGTIDRQSEIIEQQNKKIEELLSRKTSASSETDDAILVDRQSAHTMRLPVVNGVPVISGKLERVVGVPGIEYLMNVSTADGNKYSFPFGCDISRIDFSDTRLDGVQKASYETISTQDFKLVDIDENDLTGASKVEKGKIVGEGGVIPEVDRSSGRPVLTGRKIRTVVRADIRHYQIQFNGKKYSFTNEELGNFRI